MTEVVNHYINGKIVEGTSGNYGDVYNPALGEVIRKVAFASEAELRQAVAAAKAAFPAWAATPVLRRARVMFRLKTLLEQNIDELAALLSEEHGKTVSDAKGSITRGIEVVEFTCGMPHLIKGEFSEDVGSRGRQLLHASAARRGGRHHALQLPGHDPACGCRRWQSPAATPSS